MTIIYRVQDREGRGPWRPGFSRYWVEDRTNAEFARLKPLFEDFPDALRRLTRGMYCGCGCSTIDQLRLWFNPREYLFLIKVGYRAVAMEVNAVLCESEVQCFFERTAPLWQGAKVIELYSSAYEGTSEIQPCVLRNY